MHLFADGLLGIAVLGAVGVKADHRLQPRIVTVPVCRHHGRIGIDGCVQHELEQRFHAGASRFRGQRFGIDVRSNFFDRSGLKIVHFNMGTVPAAMHRSGIGTRRHRLKGTVCCGEKPDIRIDVPSFGIHQLHRILDISIPERFNHQEMVRLKTIAIPHNGKWQARRCGLCF